MKSKIAEAIKLKNQPVAVILTDQKPDGALMFKEGRWGCVVALINAASKGKTVALSNATVVCQGGHAGCGQSIGNVLAASERGSRECFIGMTDPSARKVLPADIMSFSIPFKRFLEMEENADKSFFHTGTWQTICQRLD
ncbi:DUF169 domain-containing protein [Anaerovibrio sp.]|uniref:DUF169 domain-containing protein n=1 Tax=Anaerovibrio sp. TaxID=1872532 RepID=UPI00388D180D